jgi:GxxExxY protein
MALLRWERKWFAAVAACLYDLGTALTGLTGFSGLTGLGGHGMEHEGLTKVIIGCAMTVHRKLGPGFLESVYRNALAHEIRKANLPLQCGCRIQVCYDGVAVGNFVADMVVDGCVLVEIKAVQTLGPVHGAQLVNYLVATRIETGLLLNFGSESLQFKRKFRTCRPRQSSHIQQDVSPSPFQSIIPPALR